MLNVFVDIFAQSPVDYARGKLRVHVCVCVGSDARLDRTHTWLRVYLCEAISGRRTRPMHACQCELFGAHVPTRTSTRALELLLLLK